MKIEIKDKNIKNTIKGKDYK